MKKIFRHLILYCFSLIVANFFTHNLVFDGTIKSYLLVALILTVFELILKPIIKILLFPITLLTLGLFRSVIDTLGLYLAVFLMPYFYINDIIIQPFSLVGLNIPFTQISGFWAYFATSFIISLVFHLFSKILIIKIHQ